MITTQIDDYLRDKYEQSSRWEILLSDGTKVYQDDDRNVVPSWIDLRKYLSENKDISIHEMLVGFRDNYIVLPKDADGYYFRNSILSTFHWSKYSFIFGIYNHQEKICKVDKYDLPEMEYKGSEIRTVEEAGESLIYNNLIFKENSK